MFHIPLKNEPWLARFPIDIAKKGLFSVVASTYDVETPIVQLASVAAVFPFENCHRIIEHPSNHTSRLNEPKRRVVSWGYSGNEGGRDIPPSLKKG